MNRTLLDVISATYFLLFATVSKNNIAETHQAGLKSLRGFKQRNNIL
jgi:hypothetical protein